MSKKQDARVLATATSFATTSLATTSFAALVAIALSPTTPATSSGFSLPSSVPKGTTLTIDGANSLPHLNQALKNGFQAKFPGTNVITTENTTAAALQAVNDGRADIATVGRPLTAAEKAQGLVSMPIAQPKIAIVTGYQNPFAKSLTNGQVAKILRGEITNWSQVGGQSGPIEVVDQTEDSNTRTALGRYPVFQGAAFGNSPNTIKLSDNRPVTLLGKLNDRSISYILVDQLAHRQDVKVIPLHQVMPTDSRYSFSQPLSYVYRGPNPNPAVQAFLGYVNVPDIKSTITDAIGKDIANLEGASGAIAPNKEVEAGNVKPSTASVANVNQKVNNANANTNIPANAEKSTVYGPTQRLDTTNAIAPAQKPGFPWLLWLLPLLGLPLLGWWLLGWLDKDERRVKGDRIKGSRELETKHLSEPHSHQPPAQPVKAERPIKVERPVKADRTVKAKHSVAADPLLSDRAATRPDMKSPNPPVNPPVNPSAKPQANPPMNPVPPMASGTIALGAGAAAHPPLSHPPLHYAGQVEAGQHSRDVQSGTDVSGEAAANGCRLVIMPRVPKKRAATAEGIPADEPRAYVYWDLPMAARHQAQVQGGQHLVLRVYDATNIDLDHQAAHSFRQYPIASDDRDRVVSVPQGDRDYVAEIGYLTSEGRMLSLVRSTYAHVPPKTVVNR